VGSCYLLGGLWSFDLRGDHIYYLVAAFALKSSLMKYAIFLILVVIIIAYLIASFVAWDFNPKSWGPEGRIFIGLITGFTIIVAVKSFLTGDDQKQQEEDLYY
jgi:hypothetical protein